MKFDFMIKSLMAFFLVVGLLLGASSMALASTPEEAQAMAEKAFEYYKANGKAAAFTAYTEDPQFHDGVLYVFVLDAKTGYMLAHGVSKTLVGQNFMKLRDPEGTLFGKQITEVADKGWVDYYWLNKSVNAMQKKKTFVINAGDVMICVGVYVVE